MSHQGRTCPEPGRPDKAAKPNTRRAPAPQRGRECGVTEPPSFLRGAGREAASQGAGSHGRNSAEPGGRCSLGRICLWLLPRQAPDEAVHRACGHSTRCSVAAGRQTQVKPQFLMAARALGTSRGGEATQP